MILPTQGIIHTMNMPHSGMVYIVRRSENPNGVTLAIALQGAWGLDFHHKRESPYWSRGNALYDDKSVATTSMHNYMENLAKAAALNKDASDALAEILARACGNSYEAKKPILDAIYRYASCFKVTGRSSERVDAFFQISALAVYAVANSSLEESVDFPVATFLSFKLQDLA
ncbi:unnamed protein product [Clonostachys rosea f. rosea IK726]|uniref:Uncharacterized protein n=1 Tax=Clonostachys rosea f. rosea IK726 TaxID=1349383 RepID=A0ACA9TI33_BIOOC|nr:unnamed protein product [Clonostachys rosea f. rosea IK726]